MITVDEFSKAEMKVGLVVGAVNQEGSKKLIKLTVDLGEENPRIIFAAVRPFGYTPEYFTNKKFIFVTNLEPKKIITVRRTDISDVPSAMDEYSWGMILAVCEEGQRPIFVVPAEDAPIGAIAR